MKAVTDLLCVSYACCGMYMHLSLAVIPAKNGLLTTEAVDAVPEEQYMPQQVCNTQDKSVTLEVRP